MGWPKGKKRDPETTRKIRETKEARGYASTRRYGPLSDEQKEKQSKALKGRPAHNRGVPMSDEAKRKASSKLRGKPSAMKGRAQSPEARRKISEASRKQRWTEERRIKTRESIRKSFMRGRKRRKKYAETNIERIVRCYLEEQGVEFIRQARILSYEADFLVGWIVIECDGKYWHSLPGRPQHDAEREEEIKAQGFAVIRLPEDDILDGSFKNVLSTCLRRAE